MLVLGIETSCDETALAIVEDGRRILAAQVASSLKEHQPYGGVVPEIASRAHVELLTVEMEALLKEARVVPQDIDRIAVTHGPGLAGSLIIGVAAAKALGIGWNKPVVGVNHLQAHLYAALMEQNPWDLDAPMIGLVISGGHTAIVRMEGIRGWHLLGQTRDDAVGEAFDKVAKLLRLGFPGGPEIERVARAGNPKVYRFASPRMKSGSLFDFSLSGIKTAVLYKVQEIQRGKVGSRQKAAGRKQSPVGSQQSAENCGLPTAHCLLNSADCRLPTEFVADMAASFQASVIEEVVAKVMSACRFSRVSRVTVGGGVVANQRLRERLAAACAEEKVALALPSMKLCTDNGVMIAGLGFHLQPDSSVPLTTVPDLRIEWN